MMTHQQKALRREFNFSHCEYCDLSFAIRDESEIPGLCRECCDELFPVDEGESIRDVWDLENYLCVECGAAFGGHDCWYCATPLCCYCWGEHMECCDPEDSDLFDEDDDLCF
jgi:hypothetical protein